jgi:predicted Zn-dependent protease
MVRTCTKLPGNFGGYHFEVLDSDEINGVSGPGGFVLVTRGAVEACASEAELASILAHELAHIRAKHGESLVRKNRQFPGFIQGLAKAGSAAAGQNGLTSGLAKFLGQVAGSMANTAMSHGYGRALEFVADREGTWILANVWYDHTAMRSFLKRLGEDPQRHAEGETHASPEVRVQALDAVIAKLKPFKAPAVVTDARLNRFQSTLGRSGAIAK